MEIVGLRQSGSLSTCPKCSSPLVAGQTECLSCGVLIGKVLAQIEDPLQADYRTEFGADFTDQWRLVVSDYENIDTHWKFILSCQQFKALEFAAYRYRRLAEVVNDDIARAMLTRIQALILCEVEEQRLDAPADERDELMWLPKWFALPIYFIAAIALFLGFGGRTFFAASVIGTLLLLSMFGLRWLLRNFQNV